MVVGAASDGPVLGRSVATSEEEPDELAEILRMGSAFKSVGGRDATPEMVLSESVERRALSNLIHRGT
jgi:hypothetical protein